MQNRFGMLALKNIEFEQPACAHCGVLVSNGETFCCNGCKQVYALLHDQGLGAYYSLLKENPPECPIPAQVSSDSYSALDDEKLIANATIAPNTVEFFIDGLNCSACLWLLERLPKLCSAVARIHVDMSRSVVRVTRQPNGSFSEAARTLNKLGYRPVLVRNTDETQKLAAKGRRKELVRLGIAGAATGNIMLLAVAMYAGADGAFAYHFRWLTTAMSLPVLTYCAAPFYRQAYSALRNRAINIDLPIVAAILVGVLVSIEGLISGAETLYFDSLSTLVFLLLASRMFLANIQRHYLNTSHLEDELVYGTYTRVDLSGKTSLISVESIQRGDVLRFSVASQIPVDGEVVRGEGFVQTAALTGESTPIAVADGVLVEAGSRFLSGTWDLRVDKLPRETRLASILRDAEALTKTKPRIEKLADSVGQIFIAVVFMAALLTFAYFSKDNPKEGIARAMALIIVTCPCVFGMAIPLSLALAVRRSARHGIIVKNADLFERLLHVRDIYFDKTGTLTTGQLKIIQANDYTFNQEGFRAAVALEANQEHPVAIAIRKNFPNWTPLKAMNVELVASGGIRGIIEGSAYSIRPFGIGEFKGLEQKVTARFGVFRDQALLATFELADEIRSDAKDLIQWLKANSISVNILSGDKTDIVNACARELEIGFDNTFANSSPEKKSATLKLAGKAGAMVGDGANDAAALAAANIGIAIRGSMDISLRAADVYLATSNLKAIRELFENAKSTRRAILRNLFFSAGFNVISGTLAICGYMTPLWAAVLMPTSSMIVLLSALAGSRRKETV